MFAVVFVVQPRKECWDQYLELAKELKPVLEGIEGFLDNERFGSKRHEGRLLSLSTWRDEKAVIRWRTQARHHSVQEEGRFHVFADYHLRVGEIVSDDRPPPGLAVAEKRFDETETGVAKALAITEVASRGGGGLAAEPDELPAHLGLSSSANGLVDQEIFESIYSKGKLLLLTSWTDAVAASRWTPTPFAGAGELRHRRVRVIRDYGMFDRREAPQFYPEAERANAAGQGEKASRA